MSISEGKWNQAKGKIKERWGDLTDDDFKQAEGNTDQLAGKIQEKFGQSKEDVKRELDEMFADRDDNK